MNKRHIIYTLLLLTLPLFMYGQRWKRTRYEIMAGIGPSNMLGDLGGMSRKGSQTLLDYDGRAMRVALFVGIRYKVKEKASLRLNIIPGYLSGSDLYTKADGRSGRLMTANAFIVESSLQLEYSLIKEKLSSRYTFRNMNDFKMKNVNTYLFLGVGGTYFVTSNTSKRPDFDAKAASGITLSIPVGLGFKYGLSRKTSLGLEVAYRYTFTDQLDAYASASPGNKANDAYMVILISVAKKLRTGRNGLPKF